MPALGALADCKQSASWSIEISKENAPNGKTARTSQQPFEIPEQSANALAPRAAFHFC
jgi:hypothetical protein